MKTLLLSTAILSATALAGMAQDTAPETAPVDEKAPNMAAPDTAAPDTAAAGESWDSGYVEATDSDLTSERLTGAPVYGPTGDEVGEVSEITIGADEEKIDAVIVDVGGFLGLGEKPVELSMKDLNILRSEENEDLRIGIPMTEKELEELPEYTG